MFFINFNVIKDPKSDRKLFTIIHREKAKKLDLYFLGDKIRLQNKFYLLELFTVKFTDKVVNVYVMLQNMRERRAGGRREEARLAMS